MAIEKINLLEEYLMEYVFKRQERAALLASISPNADDPIIAEAEFLTQFIVNPHPEDSLDNVDPDSLHHGD